MTAAQDRAPAGTCEGTAGAPNLTTHGEPVTLTPADVLTGAATIINTLGWTQGDWTENDWTDTRPCPVCVLAALNIAAGRHASATICGPVLDAAEALAAHLGLAHLLDEADDPHEAFVEVLGAGWNDDHARTQDEVVAALHAAAAKAVQP